LSYNALRNIAFGSMRTVDYRSWTDEFARGDPKRLQSRTFYAGWNQDSIKILTKHVHHTFFAFFWNRVWCNASIIVQGDAPQFGSIVVHNLQKLTTRSNMFNKPQNIGLHGITAKKLLGGLLSIAVLAWAQPALASSDDTRYEACPRCEPKNLAWSAGQFDQIYLIPAVDGARHLQPRALNAEPLAKLLTGLGYQSGGKAHTFLNEESAIDLAKGLVVALGKAGPQQEVAFFITSRGNDGFFATKVGNSGTAFLDERGLNLIFGEAGTDFFGAYKATRIARPFDFGSRAKASKVTLLANGLSQPRADWVIVPLGLTPAAVSAPPQTVGNPAPSQGVSDTRVLQSVGASAPSPVATPPQPAAAAPAHPVAPAARDEQFYQAQETRLKGLKRLRDQNLISEEEYQAKRKDILSNL
jgi:hypothetical protein